MNSDTILREQVIKAARIIQQGGVVVFPTTGLYGIGADAANPAAIERIFKIKHRSLGKPISVIVKDENDVGSLATYIPPTARILMARFWPGNITLILSGKPHIPELLTAGTGKIGIRVPAHPVAAVLINQVDCPITATSANLSGYAGCSRITELDPSIIDSVDMVIDAGALKGVAGSTVVDVTVDPPEILREGVVPTLDILAVL